MTIEIELADYTYMFIEDFDGIETLLVGQLYASAWYDDSTNIVPVTRTMWGGHGVEGKLVLNCTLTDVDMCAMVLQGLVVTTIKERMDISDSVIHNAEIGR